MSMENVVKDMLRDIENLKAVTMGSSDILDEILNMSEGLTFSDSLPAPTAQNTGTFLVGTARVGFADCA